MKWIMLFALLGYASTFDALAAAQSPPSAPYSTGRLLWTWIKGAPPMSEAADHLNIKCGPAPGQYTFPVKTIPIPATPASPPEYGINIRDVIPQPTSFPSTYYCVATAAKGQAESKESVEYPFSVTAEGIAAPTNPRLVP